MNKKSILNTMKRIVTVMLAVAMVFSVNLTSMTAHAASINKPTQQTVLSTLPEGVTGVTIGGNEATFYTDDNDSTNTYIRYVYPTDTMLSKLEDLTVVINSSKAVSWDGSDLTTETAGTYTIANVNLLNTAHKLVINNKSYILAAGIAKGERDLVKEPLDGYVKSATINGTTATVKRTITEGTCIGNIYYTEGRPEDKTIDWTTETNYISATKVSATSVTAASVSVAIQGGADAATTVNLSSGSAEAVFGNYTYSVNASFVTGFEPSENNFKIDFTELKDYEEAGGTLNSGYSWDVIDKQMEEITTALSAWYETEPSFEEGVSCMDVLQDFLKFATTQKKADGTAYFTCGTTDVDENCTYVNYIDGLCSFTLSNGMDGWMYTDRPNEAGVAPKNWYTAPIGAADYQMSAETEIAWFFVTDYSTHPWQ